MHRNNQPDPLDPILWMLAGLGVAFLIERSPGGPAGIGTAIFIIPVLVVAGLFAVLLAGLLAWGILAWVWWEIKEFFTSIRIVWFTRDAAPPMTVEQRSKVYRTSVTNATS